MRLCVYHGRIKTKVEGLYGDHAISWFWWCYSLLILEVVNSGGIVSSWRELNDNKVPFWNNSKAKVIHI